MQRQKRAKDRRSAVRFEIVGVMHTTVATEMPLDICNVGPRGVLVEAPWPLPQDSVHTVRLSLASALATFSARVRHARRREGTSSYLIGFEFLADDQPVLDGLELLLESADGDA